MLIGADRDAPIFQPQQQGPWRPALLEQANRLVEDGDAEIPGRAQNGVVLFEDERVLPDGNDIYRNGRLPVSASKTLPKSKGFSPSRVAFMTGLPLGETRVELTSATGVATSATAECQKYTEVHTPGKGF
jgi:hypothetical protein